MLTLYSSSDTPRFTLEPSESDALTLEVMGDAVLTLTFTLWEAASVEVGDYVEWQGERYSALERMHPIQVSSVEWQYRLRLYGAQSHLKRYLLLAPDGTPIFTLTSPAREQLRLVVDSLNAAEGRTDWKVGSVIDTDNLVIDYDGTYLDEALRKLAQAADAEWWIEGKTLNFGRCEKGETISLAYGRGLTDLERTTADNAKVYTRIYPIGSSRNINPESYGAERLQLPDRAKYVQTPQVANLGIIDHFERDAFANIYPRRIGTISAVRAERRRRDGRDFAVYYVKDETLDFDPATHQIVGKVMQMTFQDGSELAGRDFECNYNTATREFELITQWLSDDKTQLPNDTLSPHSGDRYVLWNMRMPDSYIRAAERELLAAVNDYNERHERDTSIYKVKTDFEYLQRKNISLNLGRRVRLESDEFFDEGFRDSRITKLTQRLTTPTLYDVEISDAISQGTMQRITDSVREVKQRVRRVEAGLPDIITTDDDTPPTDSNLLSALRTRRDHLRRNAPDTASEHITFADGITVGEYVGGLLGSGGRIDADGNTELQSLVIRQFLEVPELRYNRTSVHIGAAFNSPAAGIIREVRQLTPTTGRVVLKLEEGELGTVEPGDLLMGIFHATAAQGGATKDTDDGRLNLTFAGFRTVYFECTSISADRQSFFYTLRGGTTAHPSPHMTFASRGSRTIADRRQFVIATRSYTRYMVGVDSWEIQPKHIMTQLGDLSSLGKTDVNGHGLYSQNVFLTGKLLIPGKNRLVEEVIADVERQITDTAAYDQFSPDGVAWHEPPMQEGDLYIRHRRGNEPWGEGIRFVGKDAEQFEIETHEGSTFYRPGQGFVGKFRAVYKVGGKDMTDTLHPSRIVWTRESQGADDEHWNALHASAPNPITITTDDLVGKTTLVATLYEANGLTNTSSSITI